MGLTAVDPSGEDRTIPAYLGYSVDSLYYVVTMGFRTRAVTQALVIDTGSDLSWIQCVPLPCMRL